MDINRMDMQNTPQGAGYAEKLDKVLTSGVTNWYNNLSKQELLDFMKDRPDITADAIRSMMANSNIALGFATQFNTVTKSATSQFEEEK